MASLYNTIQRAGSRDQAGIVTLDLLWDTDDAAAATIASEESTINGPVKVATDSDGYWIIDGIDLNTDISPSDNVYTVTEEADDEIITYYVSITTEASHWLGDVTVSQPAWVDA